MTLTKEERSQLMRKIAMARWKKEIRPATKTIRVTVEAANKLIEEAKYRNLSQVELASSILIEKLTLLKR